MGFLKKAVTYSPAYQVYKKSKQLTDKAGTNFKDKALTGRDQKKEIRDRNRTEVLEKYKQQRQDTKAAKQTAKDELKEARGEELGHISIGYKGGFDTQKHSGSKLYFYNNRIEYRYGIANPQRDLIIPATDVTGIEITGQQQTNSRISVTRMAALGVFSLAAPKRSTAKEATLIITLKDGRQIYFYTRIESEFQVHSRLATAISFYHRIYVEQQAEPESNKSPIVDPAKEILKYDMLRKRGVINEEEFQSKKRQLLDL